MKPWRPAEGHQQLRKNWGRFRRSTDILDLVLRRERAIRSVRSRVRLLSTLLLLLPLPLHLPSLELFLLVAY
jgi:hypothetical protein